MARALECPACGHRHRLDRIPAVDTFRCEQCGQALKVPTSVASDPDAPAPPARSSAPPARTGAAPAPTDTAPDPTDTAPARTGAPAPVAPPPRRSTSTARDDATRDAQVRSTAAVSATVAANAGSADTNGADAPSRRSGGRPGVPPAARPAAAPAPRAKVHWYWRVVAWIVAVPLGFLVTAWPAYKFGFIEKTDLLDIFVGTGIGRYVRLGVVTLVWAVVTALLVQLFVEGGRARANRRRRDRATATA
jgi:hypothetical protein